MAFFRIPLPATLSLLLSLHFCNVFAASGGRMGGDSFSNPPSSPSSSPASSHYSSSSPYHRNYYHHHYHHSNHHGYDTEQRGSRFQNEKSGEGEGDDFSAWDGVIFTGVVVGAASLLVYFQYLGNRGSVLMVQVGLSGKACSLQRELSEIANTADTSSSKGWHLILTETITALLRCPHYFVSGYSSVKWKWRTENLEKIFKEHSSEERVKVEIESLVNVNNIKKRRAVIPKASEFGKDYIVVTILVAVKGAYKLPHIKSIDDLKDALRSLNISSSNLMAVEVLWTPQSENDTLSEDELLENYPLLRPI